MPLCDDEFDGLDGDDVGDEDGDDPDDDTTAPCPYCRRPVYEDAERCPSCGSYLSEEDAPRRYAWWLLFGVAGGLLAVLTWCSR